GRFHRVCAARRGRRLPSISRYVAAVLAPREGRFSVTSWAVRTGQEDALWPRPEAALARCVAFHLKALREGGGRLLSLGAAEEPARMDGSTVRSTARRAVHRTVRPVASALPRSRNRASARRLRHVDTGSSTAHRVVWR